MKKNQKIFLLIAAIFVSLASFIFGGRLETIKNLGYFGIFLLNLVSASTLILPAPSFLAVIAISTFLNPFLVAVFSALGASFGELTGYAAGVGGEDFLEKSLWYTRIKKWMDKNGILTLFILAAIPNPFFDIAGMIAGATGISVKKYLLVVFTGKLIKFLAFAYIGASSITLSQKVIAWF